MFPAIPKAIPTNKAQSILGKRSVSIAKVAPFTFSPLSTFITTSSGYLVFPYISIIVQRHKVNAASKIVTPIKRFFLCL